MRPDEMRGLAKRLRARADSVLLRDQCEQQADLRQAAVLIDHLVQLHAVIRSAEAVADRLHSLFKLAVGR